MLAPHRTARALLSSDEGRSKGGGEYKQTCNNLDGIKNTSWILLVMSAMRSRNCSDHAMA